MSGRPADPTRMRTSTQPDFLRFWAGSTISHAGSGLSTVAVPIIAVQLLSGTPAQMGVLFAAATGSSLLLRIPAASWADRSASTIRIVAVGQLASALLIAAVPLLWSVSLLTFASLVVIIAVARATTAVVDAFAAPTVSRLVKETELASAYGRFTASRSAADVASPAIAGTLLQILSAPLVLLLDALSFLAAAILSRAVHVADAQAPGSAPLAATPSDLWAVLRVPFLRRCLLIVLYASLANGATSALLILFMVRQLGFEPFAVGLVLGIGAVGGIAAGIMIGRIHATFGRARTTTVAGILMVGSFAGLPLAQPGWSGIAACLLYELAGSFGATLMVITIVSEIPRRVASTAIARAMAISNVVPELAATVGALSGGFLATATSVRSVLWLSAVVAIAGSLLIVGLASYSGSRTKHAAGIPGRPQ